MNHYAGTTITYKYNYIIIVILLYMFNRYKKNIWVGPLKSRPTNTT